MSNYKNNSNIYNAMMKLSISHPFYFYTALRFSYKENNNIETMGVRWVNGGVECIYNSNFINGLNIESLVFVLIHECDHILLSHINRTGLRKHRVANIAQDVVINESIISYLHLPKLNMGVYLETIEQQLGKKYEGEMIFEEIYEFIIENIKENESNNDESDKGESGGGSGDDDIDELEKGKFDEHLDDEGTSESEKKVMIDDIIGEAKARGIFTSDVENQINKLTKTKVNYLKMFKKITSNMFGTNKKYTWGREARVLKGMKKGYKKENKSLNVILDTSGSQFNPETLTQMLSVIFQKGFDFNLVQIDTEIKAVNKISNLQQLKKVITKGGGGTVLQPAVEHFTKSSNNLLVLTDGCTDTLNFDKIKGEVLIVSNGVEVPISGRKVKQMIIKK